MTDTELADLIDDTHLAVMFGMMIENIDRLECGELEDPEDGETHIAEFRRDFRILADELNYVLSVMTARSAEL
jgi:hypothetical protein